MKEKQESNYSLFKIISIIIIVLLLLSLLTLSYFNIKQKETDYQKISMLEQNEKLLNEKIIALQSGMNSEQEQKDANSNHFQIPISDLSALTYMATNESINLFYGFIQDGKLFYTLDNQVTDANSNGAFQYVSVFHSNDEIKEYNELSNIKRIKIVNFGSDVNLVVLLITNDGKVYESSIYENTLNFSLFESLKDYNIDNILDVSSPDADFNTQCKVLLNDGTYKTINL